MKMTGITITKEQFGRDYKAIERPGKQKDILATGQNNTYYNEKLAEANENYSHSYLINLKAVEASKVQAVLDLFDGRDEVDLAEISKLTMVYALHVNKGQKEPNLPIRNEKVEIVTEFAVNKETGEFVHYKDKETGEELGQIMNITSIKVPEAMVSRSFSSFFSDVNKEEPALEVNFEDKSKATSTTKATATKAKAAF